MSKQQWIIVAILGICVLGVYCLGGIVVLQVLGTQSTGVANVAISTMVAEATNPPTPVSTATDRPTATRVVQADPATATRVVQVTLPPTGPLVTAWNKSGAAKTYRFEFDMTVKGALGGLTGTPAPNQELSFFNISGAANGKDQQMMMKGLMGAFLGGDPAKGFESMTVGGKSYIKGPLPLLGATENKWYVADKQTTASPIQTDNLFGQSDPNLDWNAFKKSGAEKFDNRSCDVFSGDKATAMKMFSSLDLQKTPNGDVLKNLDSADMKFWICDDGYMHQMMMSMEGHDAKTPTQKMSFQIRVHVYDFNADIKIVAPTNAAPLSGSFLGIVTSTPTPKR